MRGHLSLVGCEGAVSSRGRPRRLIPVIDVFAGPGGLAEGFATWSPRAKPVFDVALSIERDATACETLRLRKVVRGWRSIPDEYVAFQKGELPLEALRGRFVREFKRADRATWCAELGTPDTDARVAARVRDALRGRGKHWVLVGGPPCQAYSVVGRSRMRGRADFESDKRHTLYREYLRIVAAHAPAIFVMENVRGLLSSTLQGQRIFQKILADLRRPGLAVTAGARSRSLAYRLYGLAASGDCLPLEDLERAEDFVVRSERYGIPQTRHRVFVIGVRTDVRGAPESLEQAPSVPLERAIGDLPAVRSRLSGMPDGFEAWVRALSEICSYDWLSVGRDSPLHPVAKRVREVASQVARSELLPGSRYLAHRKMPAFEPSWFRGRARGITLHEARAHMPSDLHRYLFASAFASVYGRSPKLRDFPRELHPDHANVEEAVRGDKFGDRFRVQLAPGPAGTVTSHMAKDGHYFIHYDPAQCRSLTVREAARVQTFPDDYFFLGNRTEQYVQVGNAVPPLLARQVARAVYGVLRPFTHERR